MENNFQLKYWQICPKCNGQGSVSRPPYIPGDVKSWSSSSTVFVCDICNGAKLIGTPKDVVSYKSIELLVADEQSSEKIFKYLIPNGFFSGVGMPEFSVKMHGVEEDAYGTLNKVEISIWGDGEIFINKYGEETCISNPFRVVDFIRSLGYDCNFKK